HAGKPCDRGHFSCSKDTVWMESRRVILGRTMKSRKPTSRRGEVQPLVRQLGQVQRRSQGNTEGARTGRLPHALRWLPIPGNRTLASVVTEDLDDPRLPQVPVPHAPQQEPLGEGGHRPGHAVPPPDALRLLLSA